MRRLSDAESEQPGERSAVEDDVLAG